MVFPMVFPSFFTCLYSFYVLSYILSSLIINLLFSNFHGSSNSNLKFIVDLYQCDIHGTLCYRCSKSSPWMECNSSWWGVVFISYRCKIWFQFWWSFCRVEHKFICACRFTLLSDIRCPYVAYGTGLCDSKHLLVLFNYKSTVGESTF